MEIIETATNSSKGMTITFENGYRAFVARMNGVVVVSLKSNTGKVVRPNTKIDAVLRTAVRKFLKI